MDKLTARVTLRMGEELHKLLLDAAKNGSRPLNTEILRRLEMTFSEDLNFQFSEKINDLGENDRLSEGQRAEVLEIVKKALSGE